MGGTADARRPGDPVEAETLAGPAPERAAGPPLRDDGRGFAEQVSDHGLERRGIDAGQATGILSHPVPPNASPTGDTDAGIDYVVLYTPRVAYDQGPL